MRNRSALVALIVLGFIIVVAVLAPWLAPYPPEAQNLDQVLMGPDASHWLGTDNLGRDVLSRLLYAARLSLSACAIAVGIAVVIGVPAGLVAGYFGGWVDRIVSLVTDALMGFPYMILALGIVGSLGPSIRNAMIAIGIVYAPRLVRVTRSSVLGIRRETFLEVSHSIGTPHRVIVLRHVIPNILPPVIVQASLMLGFAMLAEASLSFLGLGAQPPAASWGSMLGVAVHHMDTQPWLMVWPGIAITVTVLCFNLIGDGLRDMFGIRDRGGN